MTSGKRRAVFLVGYHPYAPGGAEYQALLIAEALKEEMEVCFVFESPGIQVPERVNGYRLFALKSRPLLYRLCGPTGFTNALELGALLRELKPALIYQRDGGAYTGIAARYAQASGCPLVWHIANQRELERVRLSGRRDLLFSCIDKCVLDYGIRHASYIIGQARYQDELLSKRYGRRCDLIVPNFHRAPTEPIEKPDPLTVVWVANLKRLKRPDLFIRLAQSLSDLHEVRFVMAGQPAHPRYQRWVMDLALQTPNLEYLGGVPIEETNRLISRAHLMVNTSDYEGFPNTFIQAWMRRVPVISLNVDPDGVLGHAGIGVCAGTMPRLVDAARDLLCDPIQREAMGRRAERYALAHHSIGSALPPLLELLRSVAGAGDAAVQSHVVAQL